MIWKAVVTRADGGVWVRIPHLNAGHEWGPLEIAEGLWTPDALTGTTSAHTHDVGVDLVAGDRVLVAFVEDRMDSPVVLCRLS